MAQLDQRQDVGSSVSRARAGLSSRCAEPRDGVRIVGAIEQRTLVEHARVGAEAARSIDVCRAPEHLVPLSCADRDRFELLEVGTRVGEPSVDEPPCRAFPTELGEPRRSRDRGVEPGERIGRIGRELGGARICERGDGGGRIALAFAEQRRDRAGDVTALDEEVAEELPEVRRAIRRAERGDGGLGPSAGVRIELGDAPPDLGVPRRPLERGEIVMASAIEIVREARVVPGARQERSFVRECRYLRRLRRGSPARERDEEHTVALSRAGEHDVVAAGRADAGVRQERSRETCCCAWDREACALSLGCITEQRRHRTQGERRCRPGEVRPSRGVDDEGELRCRDEGHLERERARRAPVLLAGRARVRREERDRRAELARRDRDRARPGPEQPSQERLGPARCPSRVDLEANTVELTAAVPEAGDPAGHVEGKADVREPNDELDHIEARERRRPRELDPEAVPSDRETERDGASPGPRDLRGRHP